MKNGVIVKESYLSHDMDCTTESNSKVLLMTDERENDNECFFLTESGENDVDLGQSLPNSNKPKNVLSQKSSHILILTKSFYIFDENNPPLNFF